VRGVLSIGGDNPFGEAPFEIKDSLSIFEAARIASGRHPAPRFLEGEDMATYWRLIAAGSDRQDWRRVRPQRSISMFRAIMDAIEQDKIIPVILIYLIKPTPGIKGALDWRFTRIKTIDVERLCWKLLRPTEALAGEPRENSLPTIPAAEPLAIGAPAGGEAPDDVEAERRACPAALPEHPRHKKRRRPQTENVQRALKELYPDDIFPDQTIVPNANLCRKVRDKIKEAGGRSFPTTRFFEPRTGANNASTAMPYLPYLRSSNAPQRD
jgi:hypothetical protein